MRLVTPCARAGLVLALLATAPALAQDTDTDVHGHTDAPAAPVQEPEPDPAPTSVEATLESMIARIPRFAGVSVQADGPVLHVRGEVRSERDLEDLEQLVNRVPEERFVDLDVQIEDGLLNPVGPDGELESVEDAVGRMASEFKQLWDRVQSRAPLLLVAGLVVVAFWIAAWAIRRWDGLFARVSKRPLVRTTVRQLVSAALVVLGIVLALEVLQATALVSAVLGTAGVLGLAVGFAFRDIVENYLAGLLLAFQQPFSKDDVVEVDGTIGVVVRLTTRNTLLLTYDGNHVYLPNATVFKGNLTNFSRNPHRRFHFKVGVGVDEDLAAVVQTGMSTLCAMEGVAQDPPPKVLIDELGDSSVVMDVYGWVDQRTHDFLAVRTEAIRQVKEAYDEAGYDMPEPIYRVAMQQGGKAPRPPAQRSDAPVVALEAQDELKRTAEEARREESGDDLLTDAPDEGAGGS